MELKEMKQFEGYVFSTHNNNVKIELEKLYKKYCLGDIEWMKEENKKDYKMFKGFVKFRLNVSGGNESCMGSVGCGSVSGFLDEIFLFNDLLCDYVGQYRGDLASEYRDYLEELLEKSNLKQEIIEGLDIKKLILDGYDKYYELNDYEE
jgi:hypothetical protein